MSRTHDIVVIGGSAGGLEALRPLLARLPVGLPASILIVLHVGPVSYLPEILDRICPLPVVAARSGEMLQHGKVYIAIPGVHLLVHHNHLLLRRGPRENLSRPAIDPLFRSAAACCTTRVIGILLSGALSDGVAGLGTIKRCGGIALAQDPDDALVPAMPANARRAVDLDLVLPMAEMAEALAALVQRPAPPPVEVPMDIQLETAIAAQELADMKVDDILGKPSRFTCPECQGTLWEIRDGSMLRFRCHVGHAFNSEAVLAAYGEQIENTLTRLQRSHQERAALARRMAESERAEERHHLADELERRADGYDEDALLVQHLMRTGFVGPRDESRDDEPGDTRQDGEIGS
ncbi:two-component system, chemotaxis family, response regulator CheB [Enhydrobacter aerosaccus]|uniref:protein-glutamate methylesterase n=1 Tax=Enhydrobacter aerosaccus TaxID=225324 RepID=A0A1T4NW86_9HYPH|nr:chemotaxis protein CheB [Enhydrobacter aerosaccus]SJZ83316.1 two-component system, chemotaxis family, response regulator CheB [Enhydrobacter aerosaccus]